MTRATLLMIGHATAVVASAAVVAVATILELVRRWGGAPVNGLDVLLVLLVVAGVASATALTGEEWWA